MATCKKKIDFVKVVFRKVQKSKLLQCLTFNDTSCPNSYIALVDMGMILRQAIPNAEERSKMDGTQYKWADYTKKCVEIVLNRHRFAESIFCVNDPYSYSESIKDEERELRQRSMGQIPNVFIKKEDVYPIPKDLKVILAGNDNKIRIQNLVKEEFIKVATHRSII